jgi:hypothetical protein
MATQRQRQAAKRNVRKAIKAARAKKTIAHMPKRTRTALGKQAAAVARRKRTGGQARRQGRSSRRSRRDAGCVGGRRWAGPRSRVRSARNDFLTPSLRQLSQHRGRVVLQFQTAALPVGGPALRVCRSIGSLTGHPRARARVGHRSCLS